MSVPIGFGLLGLFDGQVVGVVTANFGKRYRYAGVTLTADLARLIGTPSRR